MALSTTQSIWRSGGGDQTRTAYCGSGVMAANFWISNAAVTSAANVVVSSASNAAVLTLPQGAVVLSVFFTDAGAGHVNLGFDAVNNSNSGAATIASNISIASTGAVTSGLTGTALSDLSYVTVTKQTDGSGNAGGIITYFVTDPLVGQQNV